MRSRGLRRRAARTRTTTNRELPRTQSELLPNSDDAGDRVVSLLRYALFVLSFSRPSVGDQRREKSQPILAIALKPKGIPSDKKPGQNAAT